MANGKEPKTTGEHIIALYGHITGVKRDLRELREESSHNAFEKFERKFDALTWWIIGGLGSTHSNFANTSF
jgi:hypothetical protein